MLAMRDGVAPQTISTSYSDDEQTGKNNFPIPFHPFYPFYDVGLRVIPSFCRYLGLTSTSFLVPIDYAVRVCKEFMLLGQSFYQTIVWGQRHIHVSVVCRLSWRIYHLLVW